MPSIPHTAGTAVNLTVHVFGTAHTSTDYRDYWLQLADVWCIDLSYLSELRNCTLQGIRLNSLQSLVILNLWSNTHSFNSQISETWCHEPAEHGACVRNSLWWCWYFLCDFCYLYYYRTCTILLQAKSPNQFCTILPSCFVPLWPRRLGEPVHKPDSEQKDADFLEDNVREARSGSPGPVHRKKSHNLTFPCSWHRLGKAMLTLSFFSWQCTNTNIKSLLWIFCLPLPRPDYHLSTSIHSWITDRGVFRLLHIIEISLSILIWGCVAFFFSVQVNHNTLIHLGGNREADDELTLIGLVFTFCQCGINPACITLSWWDSEESANSCNCLPFSQSSSLVIMNMKD